MRIGKDMIKQAEAQFLMDCALPPESAGTRQGYLIGKKPGMPEQDFMTDVSYGYLVRECMEKAAAGLDYGIASRARVYQGMDLFFRAVLFCGKGYLLADDAIYDWCCREYQEGDVYKRQHTDEGKPPHQIQNRITGTGIHRKSLLSAAFLH